MLHLVLFHVLQTTAPPANLDVAAALAELDAAMHASTCAASCQEVAAQKAAVLALRSDVGPWQRREAAVLAVEAWLRRAESEPSRVHACAALVLADAMEVDREFFRRLGARARQLGAETCDEPALQGAGRVESPDPVAAWVGVWLAAEVWRRAEGKQPELRCDAARLLRRYRARPDAVGTEVLDTGESRSCMQLLPVAARPQPAPPSPTGRRLEIAGGVLAGSGGVLLVAGLSAGLAQMGRAAGEVGVLTDTAQAAGRPFTDEELRTIEALRGDFRAGRATALAFGTTGGVLISAGVAVALTGRALRLRQASIQPWADGRVAGIVWTGAF